LDRGLGSVSGYCAIEREESMAFRKADAQFIAMSGVLSEVKLFDESI
jgi:hypothetical protein